jgi:hypothetical protein
MPKINIMVDKLENSQLCYFLLRNIGRQYAANNHDADYIITYNVLNSLIMKPACSIMSMAEIYGQEGTTIATDTNLALKLINIPGPFLKIIYLWDLDWLRSQNKNWEAFAAIYRNPSLKIICRSESHAKLLQNTFNVNAIGVVENFNLQQIYKLCY